MELVREFEETGSVYNKETTMERVLDEACQIGVLGYFAVTPTISIPKISKLTSTFIGFINKILKQIKVAHTKGQCNAKLIVENRILRLNVPAN